MTLSDLEIKATVESIADVQVSTGMIPWFPGGHCDPWNHVETAMALTVGGLVREAEHAYQWLVDTQHDDGSWFNYYIGDGVEDYRLDTNCVAYIAVGAWQHYLATADIGFLESLWPVINRAVNFVVALQQPRGEILWCIEPWGAPGRFALLTGSSSIYLSLRCAVAISERLGHERPEWELAAGKLAAAVAHHPEAFESKDRWAMDWYYPVLCGAVSGESGRTRLGDRWDDFVMKGLGVRCVSDNPWATAAETAECAMSLNAVGMGDDARRLMAWTRHFRDDDGSYWTGCVHPQCVRFPGGERSTYTAAAIVLANSVLEGCASTAGIFTGARLPAVLEMPDPALER